MDELPIITHIEVIIDGRTYKATYIVDGDIVHVAATADTADATVSVMMAEVALRKSLRK